MRQHHAIEKKDDQVDLNQWRHVQLLRYTQGKQYEENGSFNANIGHYLNVPSERYVRL